MPLTIGFVCGMVESRSANVGVLVLVLSNRNANYDGFGLTLTELIIL